MGTPIPWSGYPLTVSDLTRAIIISYKALCKQNSLVFERPRLSTESQRQLSLKGVDMATKEGAQQILAGLKEAGINLVASVPDINVLQLINLLYNDREITHIPVGREEEGIGVCTGAYLGGKRTAMLMQNGGLLNSCNGLTTTALQFGIPMLLLVYYAGDMGDKAFHMVGLATEPVLQGLGIKYRVMRDRSKVKQDIVGAATAAESSKRPVALLLSREVL